jgi:zinc/manganese transport system substrate-binding protein/manganese/iron transport system substrate-binding protein
MPVRLRFIVLVTLAIACLVNGCTPGSRPASATDRDVQLPELEAVRLAAGEKLRAVATTGLVGDVVANVAGDAIWLTTLMKPGQDPHSFQPIPRDLAAIEQAHVVFINGFHLEEGLEATIDATVSRGRPVVALSAGITPRGTSEVHEGSTSTIAGAAQEHVASDPHVWFDPANVKIWVQNVAASLSALDPTNAATYQANAAAYVRQLDELNTFIQAQVARIPAERRKLVTDHDAFGYFADRYGFRVIGAVIPALSTTAEPSAGDLADLIAKIRAEQVPAVFISSQTNARLPDLVAAETGAQVLRLYTGELGPPGSGAETYIGMMRLDVETLVKGLGQ